MSENRYSICTYRYDDDPSSGAAAGAAYNMDGGDGSDDYEGGEGDDYEGDDYEGDDGEGDDDEGGDDGGDE